MHKTRENINGTFSIGKTWGIDQLERLEEIDALGFIITVQKPYYWMTETPKEKYAFVTALITIYRRFTGGKSPEVIGFESIFRQAGSENAQRESVNPYATPPAKPPSNIPPQQNPYAVTPPQPQTNPYATSPSPYATSAPVDPYAAPSVPPLKLQRLPAENIERRAYPPERIPSRDKGRGSPEGSRSREPSTNNGVPPVPPLNLSRQTSESSAARSIASETVVSSYDPPPSIRGKRQDDDASSLNSIGSRTGRAVGPRSMMSSPALRDSPNPSQRALSESPIPGRPNSVENRSPSPSVSTTKSTSSTRHAPKLSISTSSSVPPKLQNGPVSESPESPAAQVESPVKKRPKSIDDPAPSEEMLSAAMLEIESLLTTFDWSHPTPCATRLKQYRALRISIAITIIMQLGKAWCVWPVIGQT